MKFTKALVTGAGGFIGSHLVERLVREGIEVCAFVHYNSRHDIGLLRTLPPPFLKKTEIVFGELKDPHSVAQALRDREVVFHLGALIGIPYSYQNPRDVVETNVTGTLNVLMAARECGVRRVLHTSTSEVYGTAQTEKISEKHPLQGQSPYAASKIGADKIVESFAHSYRLPAVTIRPFNTFGPRQSMRAVIPTIIAQALFQEEVVLGSLDPVRDFTYVEDTAEAFLLGAAAEGVEGEVFNLGSDSEISIKDIVRLVFKLTGREKPVRTVSERKRPAKSEVLRLRSDYAKAREKLGWRPKVSFEEGLRKTIQWIEARRAEYSANHYVT
ncbi:MAG: SDR family NAD(P)-dependent oxidoreductase [Deltaproteobacteria bacterium]|nr:SDR family NAD(P)-dependent oxidoreductase [Deltaproteobacteria bacterium]